MQPTRPIHSHITFPAIQPRSSFHTASRTDATKLEQAIENRTVISHIVPTLLLGKAIHIVRGDALQEVDILVRVELCHLVLCGGLSAVNFEFLVEAIVHDE